MAVHLDREHYIPLRRDDLLNLLCHQPEVSEAECMHLKQLAKLLSAVFHFEFHDRMEELKSVYGYFNPDSTTWLLNPPDDQQRAEKLACFFEQFHWLMERANFQRLDLAELEVLVQQVSDWGLNMVVDFDLFERMEIYARGDTVGTRYRRRWWKLWKLESVRLPVFQRLVVAAKLKPHAKVPESVNTDGIFLKIFKDIPKVDLEMLLPGAEMRMPGMTRLKLGGSILSTVVVVLYKVVQTLFFSAALGFVYLWGLMVAILGYGYRQYHGYQSTKTACTLRLTQSLYYQNLDNNAGVLFHVLDEAEEQEWRETILAYYCLWKQAGDEGWTIEHLDDVIEAELNRMAGVRVDFEVEDAIHKLERLGLAIRDGDRYRVQPIEKSLAILDEAWDNYFTYHKEIAPHESSDNCSKTDRADDAAVSRSVS